MLNKDKIFFTDTDRSKKGKHMLITPANSYMKYLSYGRITMDSGTKPEVIETGGEEVALICVSGKADITFGGESYSLVPYDSVYLPRAYQCSIETGSELNLIMVSAPSEGKYEPAVVRYSKAVKKGFVRGDPPFKRKNIDLMWMDFEAERLLVRRAEVEAGNWLWPPHKHPNATLEEIYAYPELTNPSFVVQFAYADEDFGRTDIASILREGNAAAFPNNIYHSMVCSPDEKLVLMCLIAVHDPQKRKTAMLEFQPEFDSELGK